MQEDHTVTGALEYLIKASIHNQSVLKKYHGNDGGGISSKSWLKEFCTIKLGGTRGSGHTYAMCHAANKIFQDKPVILVTQSNRFLGPIRYNLVNKNAIVISAEEHEGKSYLKPLDGLDLKAAKAIIFDTAGQISLIAINRAYDIFAKEIKAGQEFYFIILG